MWSTPAETASGVAAMLVLGAVLALPPLWARLAGPKRRRLLFPHAVAALFALWFLLGGRNTVVVFAVLIAVWVEYLAWVHARGRGRAVAYAASAAAAVLWLCLCYVLLVHPLVHEYLGVCLPPGRPGSGCDLPPS